MTDHDVRFPVDDFGNEVHWSYVQRGFSFAMHGWFTPLEAVTDNCTAA